MSLNFLEVSHHNPHFCLQILAYAQDEKTCLSCRTPSCLSLDFCPGNIRTHIISYLQSKCLTFPPPWHLTFLALTIEL